jgi:hypothetical protein
MEFIVLPTPSEHIAPIDELRKMILRSQPDLKDKPLWWKRKASVLKVCCKTAQLMAVNRWCSAGNRCWTSSSLAVVTWGSVRDPLPRGTYAAPAAM